MSTFDDDDIQFDFFDEPETVEATQRRRLPRLSGSDEMLGALFAGKPGQILGPYQSLNGWYFARLEGRAVMATAPFDSLKAQLSAQILQQRQRAFMNGYMAELRNKAKVEDLRTTGQ